MRPTRSASSTWGTVPPKQPTAGGYSGQTSHAQTLAASGLGGAQTDQERPGHGLPTGSRITGRARWERHRDPHSAQYRWASSFSCMPLSQPARWYRRSKRAPATVHNRGRRVSCVCRSWCALSGLCHRPPLRVNAAIFVPDPPGTLPGKDFWQFIEHVFLPPRYAGYLYFLTLRRYRVRIVVKPLPRLIERNKPERQYPIHQGYFVAWLYALEQFSP